MNKGGLALTHVSLFTGIGGFDLAAQWAGFETIAMCEIDPYCQKVLKKHWPNIPIIGDVRDVDKKSFDRPVTLLTAGVPCQPASTAGKRRGKADDRWLWPEAMRILREIRPAWAVFENPLGIVSLDEFSKVSEMDGEAAQAIPDIYSAALDGICGEIEQAGYEVQSVAIPACGVGAPHLRYRIFIIAHRSDDRCSRPCRGVQGDSDSPRGLDAGDGSTDISDANLGFRLESQEQVQTGGNSFVSGGETPPNSLCVGYGGFKVVEGQSQTGRGRAGKGSKDVAYSSIKGLGRAIRAGAAQAGGQPEQCGDVCHASVKGLPDWAGGEMGQPSPLTEFERPDGKAGKREIERDFRRVAYGVSHRVDRLRALGNAVVPQQTYTVLRAIADVERSLAQPQPPEPNQPVVPSRGTEVSNV